MDLLFDPAQRSFESEVRNFLANEVTAAELEDDESHRNEHSASIYARLAERGWLGMHLPTEFGGQGRGSVDLAIFRDWTSYYRVPLGGFTSASRIGHALHLLGTDQQRTRYLPPLARGEILMSIGYSEPESGSDLASLRTRAVPTDAGFVVNGQKIFTTAGHLADYIFLACRTDPEAPRHRGISVLVVDMRSEGIRIDPIWTLGGWRLNTVFFDDVFVPGDCLIGQLNGGWKVVRTALDVERTGIQPVGLARRLLDDLWWIVDNDPGRLQTDRRDATRTLNELGSRVAAARLLAYRLASRQDRGVISSHESATSKLLGSEGYQDVARRYTDLLGGEVFDRSRPASGPSLEREYRYAPQATIAAGTSEIMRNLVARDGLGLPAST